MSIIFAEPRHDYKSYEDLRALIRLSNFDTCFMDEIDAASDNTYILTIYNGEVTGWQGARAKIILWDNEWHLDGVPMIAGVSELWASDKWYAEKIGAHYVPMGSHTGLRPDQRAFYSYETYDVDYIGYIVGVHRRERMRQMLMNEGVRVSPHGAWGDERHRILSNSLMYLHVHQLDNVPTVAPLRMVVAAAYSLPVVSEAVDDPGVFQYERLLMTSYDDLPRYCKLLAETPAYLHQAGAALHEFLCIENTFRKSVEAAL